MAHHYPAAEIDAADISLDALEVAAINVERYGLEERIKLIHTDLFEGLDGAYDLIVSNFNLFSNVVCIYSCLEQSLSMIEIGRASCRERV